ncbi:MAG: 3-phosphoshikimate 1-carboxyvinyltransferase [Gammaproteobacteria bacterium]|nr:3-phosphoshikimate 1-carboxyvinyltransferase [Gammaproteobacteria bacterium]
MTQTLLVAPGETLHGVITVPGDKSISHRSLLFGALAEGETVIEGFLASEDTRATVGCLRDMGVRIEEGERVVVHGVGLHGLRTPSKMLWTGNSGTTTRLLMGVLAGQPFAATLEGDASLSRRPMDRVAIPLRMMGAQVRGQGERDTPPVTVHGGNLHAIHYTSPVASAQVKSAILLAGLYADGVTTVTEPQKSRDHTERMLRGFGVEVEEDGLTVSLRGGQTLHGQSVIVPGDISSAAFFLIAGAIAPGAEITVCNVGINPTRSGIIDVLQAMGANMQIANERLAGGEPVADITVRFGQLKATEIGGDLIPRLIDELPVLTVAAAFAEGTTVIRDARELRVKESDRIATVSRFLRDMGTEVEEREDGMVIHGGHTLHGTDVESHGDHRVAMSAAVAALAAGVVVRIHEAETIATSFPNYTMLMRQLGARIEE